MRSGSGALSTRGANLSVVCTVYTDGQPYKPCVLCETGLTDVHENITKQDRNKTLRGASIETLRMMNPYASQNLCCEVYETDSVELDRATTVRI